MNVETFLQAVWPGAGYFTLAIPFKPADSSVSVFRHEVFESHQATIAAATRLSQVKDVYFCVHSLKEPKVWNPKKIDWKTKTPGAYEIRTHQNMHMAKCLFLDIDVGNSDNKYPSQYEAISALRQFIETTGLPKPYIVSSGGGLHIYWPFVEAIPSSVWLGLAQKLKALTAALHFQADPSRTADPSSVLRLPGTLNHKREPRPVAVLRQGTCTPVEELTRIIDAALASAGVSAPVLSRPPVRLQGFADNTSLPAGPDPSFKSVVAACPQMQEIVRARGDVSEPLWYAALSVARCCRNGNSIAHKMSAGAPSYSYEETEARLARLEAVGVGPTKCETFSAHNPAPCQRCPAWGKTTSPVPLARKTEQLPPPVAEAPKVTVQTVKNLATLVPVGRAGPLPSPPPPFGRSAVGVTMQLGSSTKPDEDDETAEIIQLMHHDFYPVRRYRDQLRGTETHVWVADLPLTGKEELHLPAEAMYDLRKLGGILANRGVITKAKLLPHIGSYMSAYIRSLQAAVAAETVRNVLGWNDELTEFTLPEKVLHSDGTVTVPVLSQEVTRAVSAVHSKGSMARQLELLEFFDHPDYAANQFVICAALGSPLFYMTGHHGVVLNMSGPPGASKSTTLYTGAGLWGDPLRMTINGTTRGATANARDNRMMVMANLPQLVDEITRMAPKDMADMAMGVTQSEGRLRLETTGSERRTAQSNKSTILICTANTSLYSALASDRADSTAEAVRVFEIPLRLARVHTKAQADDYLQELKANYGHVGEQFMSYVIQNRAKIHERVRTIMRAVDSQLNISGSERFWSATAAVACCTCEIAAELGLFKYNVKTLWRWLAGHQVPSMRRAMTEQYLPPVSVLADYLETINGNMLVVQTAGRWSGNLSAVIREPKTSQLLARHEVDNGKLWLQRKAFKDYCTKAGHNYMNILETLQMNKIIHRNTIAKVLGAGTDYAKGQTTCLQLDMRHPDLVGAVADNPAVVVQFPGKDQSA